MLRVPKPGHSVTSLVAERLENGAYWMVYMEEHNVMRVPHVYRWSSQGTDGIGPFILIDFVEGENLREYLGRLTKSNDAGDRKKREFIYEQIAGMYLQLNRQRFDRIGSIVRTSEGQWTITKRPLTMDMHQQVLGVPNFPTDTQPTGSLPRSQDYKSFVAGLHTLQLCHLRTLKKENIQRSITKA